MRALAKASKRRRSPLTLSNSDLEVLLHESEVAAARLARRFRVPPVERDDLRQDLLVDLLDRTRSFDPTRGKLGAFAGTVVRHRAARIACRIRRERRFFVEAPMNSMLSSADGIHFGGDQDDAEACHDLPMRHDAPLMEGRIDLQRALAGLSSTDIRLCGALIDHTPTEISRSSGRSRASIYRAIEKIRTHIVRSGISIAA